MSKFVNESRHVGYLSLCNLPALLTVKEDPHRQAVSFLKREKHYCINN